MSDNSLSTAIENARQYHMRQVTSTLPDSRDAVRNWRAALHESIGDASASASADYLAFLGNGVASHRELFERLRSRTLNPHASWYTEHLRSLPTPDSYSCGEAIDTMRTNIQSILSMYRTTLVKTVEADAELHRAVAALEIAAEVITQPETIRAMYEAAGIQEKYKTYCKLYSISMALRSLMHPLHEVTRGDQRGIVCNLCFQTSSQSVAFVPCGHVVCSSCMYTDICYVCQCAVEQSVHLQI
jgi:hypothetical protein